MSWPKKYVRDRAPYALALGVLVFAPVTGAALKRARAFGPPPDGGSGPSDMFLVSYVIGPLVGASPAAAACTAIVPSPQEKIEQRPIDALT